MTYRDENAAWDRARRRFITSPEVQNALESLRTRQASERKKRASVRRKRLWLATELLLGALCAALAILSAAKLCLILAK